MTDAPERPPLASVAMISSAALATEIALTRTFALVHWHHFAYMIISLSLLGYGLSGTWLAHLRGRLTGRFRAAFVGHVLAFGALSMACPLLARSLPFQAEALLWDPWQPLWLVLTYLVLSVPFLCAGSAIGLALLTFRRRAGRVYAADLAGAGLGCLAVLGLLHRLPPEDVFRVVAATAFLAAAVGALELRARPALFSALAALGLCACALLPRALLAFQPGPYKGLSQALRVPGTRVVLERTSPLGRVTVVESPRVPLRLAPGLSIRSPHEPPPQLGLFTDGDDLQAVTAASADPASLAYLAETTSALAYHLLTPRSVLVPDAGGGEEVLRALQLGAARIDALVPDPLVVGLLTGELADHTGGRFTRPGVHLTAGEARGFLARTGNRYDLVQVTLPGGAGGGLGGLSEDYRHTVEAMRLYLDHLEPGGFLSVTGPVQVPPRDGLKLLATVAAALASAGRGDPAGRLLMIRGWQTATLLVKDGEVAAEEIRRLRAFCEALSFDPVWFPGIRPGEGNVHNELPRDWYQEGVRALLGPDRDAFVAGHRYDIRPATDDRPFFGNFFRWSVLGEAWRARGRGGMALLEAGYLPLAATLLQAIVLGLLLVVLPLGLLPAPAAGRRAPRGRVLACFLLLGLAFMFLEVAFLQRVVLLVHHPTVALAIVLATFLLAAGAGSALTGRVPIGRGRAALALATAGIAVVGALLVVGFGPIAASAAPWPSAARGLLAAALLAPLGFCMGMPFPLVLRELDAALVPWAWGTNGCASVAGAALAALLAVDLGFAAVSWVALGLYLAACATAPGGAHGTGDTPTASAA
jgi:hypothetical protein